MCMRAGIDWQVGFGIVGCGDPKREMGILVWMEDGGLIE